MKGLTAGFCLVAAVVALTQASTSPGALEVKGKQQVNCNSTAEQKFTLKDPTDTLVINCDSQHPFSDLIVTVEWEKPTLALNLLSLSNFKAGDEFSVNVGDRAIHKESPPRGLLHLWMPTNEQSLTIRLKKGANSPAVATIHVTPACGAVFSLPKFNNLILPNNGSDLGMAICTFKVTQPALFDFEVFELSNKSYIIFSNVSPGFAGPYGEKPEHIIIGNANTEIIFTLDLSNNKQNVTFALTQLDADVCQKDAMLSLDKNETFALNSGSHRNVFCAWLLKADQQKININVDSFHFGYASDLLSVIDSGKLNGPSLLQVTNLTKNPESVVTSGKYAVVTFNSKNFDDKTQAFKFTASPTRYGGHLFGQGNLTLSSSSNYILSTDEDKSVIVSFGALTTLTGKQKIEVYTSFKLDAAPLISFESSREKFDISSPGSELRVVATGFDEPVDVTFESVARGSGCMRSFVGAQESSMKLAADCKSQSIWLVRPDVTDPEETAIYFKVCPNNARQVNITHLTRDRDGLIVLNNTSDPFMFVYKAKFGALFELEAQSDNFEISYTTAKINQPIQVNPAEGSNFTLMSPFYPGLYPAGGLFTYSITLPNKATTFLANFIALDLAQGDTLTLGSGNLQFTGSDLPEDVLMDPQHLTNVSFQSHDPHTPWTNPKGAYGFRIDLTPTGESKTFTTAEGSHVINAVNKTACKDLRCVYIIHLAEPDDKETGVSVNITFTLKGNATSLKEGSLKVWDGSSTVRDRFLAPPANLSHGGSFVSRSHRVIIWYEGSDEVNFSYTTNKCMFKPSNNVTTMCLKDRICMPPAWRCNDVLDCADGSDELFCKNAPPPPAPPVKSSNGWVIAFWLCVPLFLVLGGVCTKGWPILLQRVRETRYQQFHDLGDH